MSSRCDQPEPHEDTWNEQGAWDADDAEAPQERDLFNEDEDETPTVPCPDCRRPVPDFADRCPYCGNWIIQTAGHSPRRTPWFIVLVIVIVLALLGWYVF